MAHFAFRLDPEYVDDDGQMTPFALHMGAGAAGLAPGENPAHVVEYWGHADGTEGGPGKPGTSREARLADMHSRALKRMHFRINKCIFAAKTLLRLLIFAKF